MLIFEDIYYQTQIDDKETLVNVKDYSKKLKFCLLALSKIYLWFSVVCICISCFYLGLNNIPQLFISVMLAIVMVSIGMNLKNLYNKKLIKRFLIIMTKSVRNFRKYLVKFVVIYFGFAFMHGSFMGIVESPPIGSI